MRIDGAFIVMSAALSDLTASTNNIRTKELVFKLEERGFPSLRVSGAYKGQTEPSVIVPVRGLEDIRELQALAAEFSQESVLYVTEGRRAELLFTEGGTVAYIGKWAAVPAERASSLDAYTSLADGSVYAVV